MHANNHMGQMQFPGVLSRIVYSFVQTYYALLSHTTNQLKVANLYNRLSEVRQVVTTHRDLTVWEYGTVGQSSI